MTMSGNDSGEMLSEDHESLFPEADTKGFTNGEPPTELGPERDPARALARPVGRVIGDILATRPATDDAPD